MAARVHVTDTYDVPDTDDADADTDDDAGPCEDIVVLAKTHSGASEDTYCGSDDDVRRVRYGPEEPKTSNI